MLVSGCALSLQSARQAITSEPLIEVRSVQPNCTQGSMDGVTRESYTVANVSSNVRFPQSSSCCVQHSGKDQCNRTAAKRATAGPCCAHLDPCSKAFFNVACAMVPHAAWFVTDPLNGATGLQDFALRNMLYVASGDPLEGKSVFLWKVSSAGSRISKYPGCVLQSSCTTCMHEALYARKSVGYCCRWLYLLVDRLRATTRLTLLH